MAEHVVQALPAEPIPASLVSEFIEALGYEPRQIRMIEIGPDYVTVRGLHLVDDRPLRAGRDVSEWTSTRGIDWKADGKPAT